MSSHIFQQVTERFYLQPFVKASEVSWYPEITCEKMKTPISSGFFGGANLRDFFQFLHHLELSMIFRAKKIKQKGWQEKKKQLLKRTGKSNMNLRKSKKKSVSEHH